MLHLMCLRGLPEQRQVRHRQRQVMQITTPSASPCAHALHSAALCLHTHTCMHQQVAGDTCADAAVGLELDC